MQNHHLSRHGHSRHTGGWLTHTEQQGQPRHRYLVLAGQSSHHPHCSPPAQPRQVGKASQRQKSPRQVAGSWEDHAAAFLRAL